MRPFHGALPVPCVPVLVTRGASVHQRYTYIYMLLIAAPLFPSQDLCGTILVTLYSMVWFWEQANFFYWPKRLAQFLSSIFS